MSKQYAIHPATTHQGGSYPLAQPQLQQHQHQQPHQQYFSTSSQDGVSVTVNSRVSPWSAQVPLQRPRSMSDRQDAAGWYASTTQSQMQQQFPALAAAQHPHSFATIPAQASPCSGLDASTVPGSERPSQSQLYQAQLSQVPSTTWSSQGASSSPYAPITGTDSTYPSLVPATMSGYLQGHPAYAPPFTAPPVSEVSLAPATVVPPTFFNYAPGPTATTPAVGAAPAALAAASGMPMPVPSVLAQSAPASSGHPSTNPAQGSSRQPIRAVPVASSASQARPSSSSGPNRSNKQFKCDICPQAFNRNHDLKRHKRIHLAVKPFPCGWCEKTFSRKDALRRHFLVRGCGRGQGQTQEASEAGISKAPNIAALRQAIEEQSRRQNAPAVVSSTSGSNPAALGMPSNPSPPLGSQTDGNPNGMPHVGRSNSPGSASAVPYNAGLESTSTPSSSDELAQRWGPSLSRSASTASSSATGPYFAYSADGTRESSPSASTGSESSPVQQQWVPLPLQAAATAPFVPQAYASAGEEMFQYIHTTPTHQEPPQQQQQQQQQHSSMHTSVSGHQQQQQADYFPSSFGLPPATCGQLDPGVYAPYQNPSFPL